MVKKIADDHGPFTRTGIIFRFNFDEIRIFLLTSGMFTKFAGQQKHMPLNCHKK